MQAQPGKDEPLPKPYVTSDLNVIASTVPQSFDYSENTGHIMETKERRPRTARRGGSKQIRSLSASGPRRSQAVTKPNPQFSATGRSMAITGKGSGASSEEDLPVNDDDPPQQTYDEKVAAMKQKVLKKMLTKADVENKLKDFKKSNKTVLVNGDNQTNRRRTSDPSVIHKRDVTNGLEVENLDSGVMVNEKSERLAMQLDPQVELWLEENNLSDNERCKNIFRKQKITIERLKTLTDTKLRTFGITNVLTLNKIKNGVQKLKSNRTKSFETPTPSEPYNCITPEDFDSGTSSQNIESETYDNDTKPKIMESKGGTPYVKPAWGSSQGTRAFTNRIKPRTRPASAGPTPRLRPCKYNILLY